MLYQMPKTLGLYLHKCSRVEGTINLFHLSIQKLKVPSISYVQWCSGCSKSRVTAAVSDDWSPPATALYTTRPASPTLHPTGVKCITCTATLPPLILHPSILPRHCVIRLEGGVATLHPFPGSLCLVNASPMEDAVRLSQGCVIVLGKTNMFRYNDPLEAADLRRNMTEKTRKNSLMNQSLLSQVGKGFVQLVLIRFVPPRVSRTCGTRAASGTLRSSACSPRTPTSRTSPRAARAARGPAPSSPAAAPTARSPLPPSSKSAGFVSLRISFETNFQEPE